MRVAWDIEDSRVVNMRVGFMGSNRLAHRLRTTSVRASTSSATMTRQATDVHAIDGDRSERQRPATILGPIVAEQRESFAKKSRTYPGRGLLAVLADGPIMHH